MLQGADVTPWHPGPSVGSSASFEEANWALLPLSAVRLERRLQAADWLFIIKEHCSWEEEPC